MTMANLNLKPKVTRKKKLKLNQAFNLNFENSSSNLN